MIAILFAPFRNRSPEVAARTDDAIRHLLACGWTPLFLPYMLDRVLDDYNPEQRARALQASAEFVQTMADEPGAWAFDLGIESEGVKLDREMWGRHGLRVRLVTFDPLIDSIKGDPRRVPEAAWLPRT